MFKVPTKPASKDVSGSGASGEIFMTIGSLFSGIGGLELGLEWAGLGPTIWQVEKDEKCRNCLATHWPEAKRFEDVCTVGRNELEAVDLICGGFPCQDVSSAGKRVGLSGARSGLWTEFLRVVTELRPSWVVVENVASGAKKWVDQVRGDLERAGYSSLSIPLGARDVGAWHKRGRIFVVAHSDGEHVRIESGRECGKSGKGPTQLKRFDADTHGKGELQSERHKPELGRWTCDGNIWAAEPDVARMVYGLPGRAHRERALGNSVVPQCAEVIGEVIKLLAAP